MTYVETNEPTDKLILCRRRMKGNQKSKGTQIITTFGLKVAGDGCADDNEYDVDDADNKSGEGDDDGDGDHRQLKDDGKGSEAKEAKHGKTEQDCPVDVLQKNTL